MKRNKNYLDKLVMEAQLPAEGMPKQPLVELFGHKRLLIENHKGVLLYGCNEIWVRVVYGQLKICGSCLQLAQMTQHQLVIIGKIEGITICREKNDG